MKLYMVGASPYARKVRAAAVALGLEDRLEIVIANPHERPADLVGLNPLSKVPTLVTDDGTPLADSYAICEHLARLVPGQTLIPLAPGPDRDAFLQRHALGHGLMDCGVIRRVEGLKTPEPDRLDWMARQQATIARVLDRIEAEDPLPDRQRLDDLTLAAALGFLDFRFPDEGWRTARPRLAAWHRAAETWPAMARTRPFP